MAQENQKRANYTQYTTEIHHESLEGIYPSPVAGPNPQHLSLVRLHARLEIVQIYWTATREGAAPQLPHPDSFAKAGNYNRVYLGGARSGLVEPTLGGHSYSISGVYVYALSEDEGLDSAFSLSMCPWEDTNNTNGMTITDFGVPAGNFVEGILNAAPSEPLELPPDPDVPLLNPWRP